MPLTYAISDFNGDKSAANKLVPVRVDFSKLSDVVKNNVVEKDLYNTKIKNIEYEIPNFTDLATNTAFTDKVNEVKNGTPSITKLTRTVALNARINEVKNKLPNITNLATTTALTAVENEIPGHSKYITTPELNMLTAENIAARLAQANLASKNDIANFLKRQILMIN